MSVDTLSILEGNKINEFFSVDFNKIRKVSLVIPLYSQISQEGL